MVKKESMSPLQQRFSTWIRDEPRVIRDISRIATVVTITSIAVSIAAVGGTLLHWWK